MASGIRIEYPGAFYHIMARGNRRGGWRPATDCGHLASRHALAPTGTAGRVHENGLSIKEWGEEVKSEK